MKSEQHFRILVETITNPKDCVSVALAIETLAYHDKNLLDVEIKNDADRSVVLQQLLKNALLNMG